MPQSAGVYCLRGRSSCADSVRVRSPPEHRAAVVCLRFGEPTVRRRVLGAAIVWPWALDDGRRAAASTTRTEERDASTTAAFAGVHCATRGTYATADRRFSKEQRLRDAFRAAKTRSERRLGAVDEVEHRPGEDEHRA